MKLLLDTTVLIDVLRRRAAVMAALAEAVRAGHELGTSAINLAEVHSGVRSSEEILAQKFLATLVCYPVTASIAERGGRLRNQYARKGKTLGLADAVIAATALEHGLVLATENRKDFPMSEISFYPMP
jgi:predicted nucleic acid-binding protein